MREKYTYHGAVYVFGRLVAAHWEASTWAISEAKAVANLKYRFRKDVGIVDQIPITFSEQLIIV